MKKILEEEGGLEGSDTCFVIFKIKGEGLVMLDVLKSNKNLMIKRIYLPV